MTIEAAEPRNHGGTMFFDFEFRDDGRLVLCTRGMRRPGAEHATDAGWWYLSLERAAPVRLLRASPGETREDVWESALRHLDALEVRDPAAAPGR
jgi:hypothetical protein